MIDLSLDNASRAQLTMLKWLGEKYLRPLGIEADRLERPIPPDHEFFLKVLEMGLGGRGLNDEEDNGKKSRDPDKPSSGARRGVIFAEEASYWDRGSAVALPGPGLGGAPIHHMGTSEQKERFLGPFRQKDRPRWGAFGMTEAGAGSDVAGIRTTAVKDGDHYVLNGSKTFISNSQRAEWVVVFATVDPSKGRDAHRAFVVEKGTPGFAITRVEKKIGLRAYETCSFTLDNCRIPVANLLGGEAFYEGRAGFKGAMKSFDSTRPIVAVMSVGIARAAWEHARDFIRQNYVTDRPVPRYQRILERLALMRMKIDHARLLCWRAAWLADHRKPNTLEASIAKAYAPPVALEATRLGLEIMADAGITGDAYLDKLYRDVKVLDIVEGTQQIQRIVIARRIVDYPGVSGEPADKE